MTLHRISRTRYVLDASIAMKWFLRDEDHVEQSTTLLHDYQAGRIEFIAPLHIQFEVPNAFRNAMRRDRMTVERADRSLERWLRLRITTAHSESLVVQAMALSARFDCAFFDGLYLALSQLSGLPFVHADERLRNTLEDRFPNEVWIADFSNL